MQGVAPAITDEVFAVLTVDASVASRTSFGGTAPELVRAAAAAAAPAIWSAMFGRRWAWVFGLTVLLAAPA